MNTMIKADQEMVDFVVSIISEKHDISDGLKVRLARSAINSDKVGDDAWIKSRIDAQRTKNRKKRLKQLKREKRDPVFKQFSYVNKVKFHEAYGEEAFEFMKRVLDDPAKIAPRWGSQFWLTCKDIGIEEVEEHYSKGDVYSFITKHKKWAENRQASAVIYHKKKKS
jgi:hypothetical protein